MNESRLIYDYLFSQNLSADRIEEGILKQNKDSLIQLIHKLNDLVPEVEYENRSKFNLVANTSLSGSVSQCSNLVCRTSNLSEFARKSVLYADKVWIKFPLDRFNEFDLNISELEHIQEALIHDLTIIHKVRLLVESGIFSFAVSKKHFCFKCFGSISDEVSWPMVREMEILKEMLKEKYVYGAKYNLRQISRLKWQLVIKAKTDELFYHKKLYYGINNVKKEFPKSMFRYSKLVKPDEVINSSQVDKLVNLVLENIVMQNWYSVNTGANYVTNIPIELNSAKIISNEIKDIDFNYDGLEHALPTIDQVGISKLIELREKSPEAFVNYRNSFDKVLNQAKTLQLSEQQELINDELIPVIDQLNQNIKLHKDKLIKGTLHSLILGSSLVAVSVFPGILPVGLSAIPSIQTIAGIAAAHQSKDLLQGIKGLTSKEYEEKDNKYYFLWKALK